MSIVVASSRIVEVVFVSGDGDDDDIAKMSRFLSVDSKLVAADDITLLLIGLTLFAPSVLFLGDELFLLLLESRDLRCMNLIPMVAVDSFLAVGCLLVSEVEALSFVTLTPSL